jgi:hypothetical protein
VVMWRITGIWWVSLSLWRLTIFDLLWVSMWYQCLVRMNYFEKCRLKSFGFCCWLFLFVCLKVSHFVAQCGLNLEILFPLPPRVQRL